MISSAEKSIKQINSAAMATVDDDERPGKNMMRVMDDYEVPADENDSYGPFTKKVINADLNTNIAEQVVFEAAKSQ